MLASRTVVQQAAQTGAPTKSTTTERAERPEQPERPEHPEVVAGHLAKDELRAQIRATIQAAQEASRDAANEVRIANGQLPVPPALPGHTIQGPIFGDNVIPQQAVDIATGFFVMCAVMVVGWPLARAFGRRLEKGGQTMAMNPAMTDQLQRIEQAVDAMSIEIERISESQRFMAKLQTSQVAEPVALPASDRR